MKEIAIAMGDGIGPEIMEATLRILKSADVPLSFKEVIIGEKAYLSGHQTGIPPEAWDTIRNRAAFLKAPITTPQGGGFKSLNVTIRTALGLYANVRPAVSYSPFIATKHPEMNVVIIRENEEDLYSGLEYQQSEEVASSLKLISQPGSEKICRFAFEYALNQGRKKVTCFTKDNIMKLSDGLFHRVFEEVAKDYPDIEHEHWIVDIGAAKLADTPENFDVIVLPNLYGDILSDVAAQISGSVGLAGSANIGDQGAMFEAIHGSAPRRAGQNVANPSGLLHGAILMLIHLGLPEKASLIHNAWMKTIEDGMHTYDIFSEKTSTKQVSTSEFADNVIERLGQKPTSLTSAAYQSITHSQQVHHEIPLPKKRTLIGLDLFMYGKMKKEEFEKMALSKSFSDFTIEMISNRGAKIYPDGQPETFCIDQWRLRLMPKETCSQKKCAKAITEAATQGFEVLKAEYLFEFDGKKGYSSFEG